MSRLLVLALCVCLYGIANSTDISKKVILVTAKAIKSKLVHINNKRLSDGSTVLSPMSYEITFSDIEVKQGFQADFKKNLTFEIDVNSDYPILNAEKLYLLVDLSEEEPKLLSWGDIIYMVCLPSEFVVPGYEHRYTPIRGNSEDKKCTRILSYYEEVYEENDN